MRKFRRTLAIYYIYIQLLRFLRIFENTPFSFQISMYTCFSVIGKPRTFGERYLTTRKNGDNDATNNSYQQHPRRYQ